MEVEPHKEIVVTEPGCELTRWKFRCWLPILLVQHLLYPVGMAHPVGGLTLTKDKIYCFLGTIIIFGDTVSYTFSDVLLSHPLSFPSLFPWF